MTLIKAKDNSVLFSQAKRADTYWTRLMGLMGKPGLNPEEAIWFTRCNAIQTCFMKFNIDCVFVDRTGKVKKVYHEVKPWRIVGPVWGATDAIEMAAGQAKAKNILEGDIIECGP